MDCSPVIVKTVYPFKGNNNDELCFKKGETIIITQKDEEWWEGTLHGKTGWFPCNYVKECKDTPRLSTPDENKFKMMVLTDLVESEKAYVKELEGLVGNFLQPLEETSMLLKKEYSQLINNIMEILDFHQQFLEALETESCKMEHLQKIGKLFLEWAPKLKNIHSAYCSFHPNAVCVLDKYRNELANYMEQRGAASPGLLVLTTLLSKPFRRLNKYSYMLQELERYVGESHPDRGDIQRAVSVFKHLAETCMAIRRQKELELQVLTGPVRGWEGPSLTSLGEIIHMSSVTLGTEKSERYLVLFSNTLIILSVSHRLSAFIYEGQLSPSALSNIRRIENNVLGFKNSFEMYGPLIEKVVVHCQHADDADKWVELLRRYHSNCFNLPTILDLNPFEHKSLARIPSSGGPNINISHDHSSTAKSLTIRFAFPCAPAPLRIYLALDTKYDPYIRHATESLSYEEHNMLKKVMDTYL